MNQTNICYIMHNYVHNNGEETPEGSALAHPMVETSSSTSARCGDGDGKNARTALAIHAWPWKP